MNLLCCVRFDYFQDKLLNDLDEAIWGMNPEYSAIFLIRQFLLKFGQSRISQVDKRIKEIMRSICLIYKKHSTRDFDASAFVIPEPLKSLPSYFFGFYRSKVSQLAIIDFRLWKTDSQKVTKIKLNISGEGCSRSVSLGLSTLSTQKYTTSLISKLRKSNQIKT